MSRPTTHAADPGAAPFLGPDDTMRISTGCGREVATWATVDAPTCTLCDAMLKLHSRKVAR